MSDTPYDDSRSGSQVFAPDQDCLLDTNRYVRNVFVTDFRLKYVVERTKESFLYTHQLEPQMLMYKMQGAIMHLDLERRTSIDVGFEVV